MFSQERLMLKICIFVLIRVKYSICLNSSSKKDLSEFKEKK